MRPSVIRFGYRQPLKRLPKVIRLKHRWLKRAYYKIRLINVDKTGLRIFKTFKLCYEVQFLHLNKLPYEKILPVLRLCLKEIFFIVKNNTICPCSAEKLRIVFDSKSLKKPINFEPVNLDVEGIDEFLHEIDRNMQSNDNFMLDDVLTLTFLCYNATE